MSVFQTPFDIANRALQMVGARRITSFSDDVKAAQEVAFCYDKLRVAELRRNVWRFATRMAVLRPVGTTTMTIIPQAWDASKVYPVGGLVIYNNVVYLSQVGGNQNLAPDLNPASWTQYFGPTTADVWDSTQTYYAGELVYTPTTAGYSVYMSLESNNTDNPTSLPNWDPTITYNAGQSVGVNGTVRFSGAQVFFNGTAVTFAASVPYQSTVDLNLNHAPGSDGTWQQIPVDQVDYMVGQKWLKLNTKIKSMPIIWPIGSGPVQNTDTRNIFVLPAGYLREAPQDPKAGNISYLGAPSGNTADDWTFTGNFIVSATSSLIVFRFVADIADVTLMDPMFCEGLAARIGLEVCEPLTQSAEKLQSLTALYKQFMSEARTVNGIEGGPVEAPEDDWVACRI